VEIFVKLLRVVTKKPGGILENIPGSIAKKSRLPVRRNWKIYRMLFCRLNLAKPPREEQQ
jgi:hypothetical protein